MSLFPGMFIAGVAPLVVTTSPALVQGSHRGTGTVVTATCTTTAQGGVPPYTYSWSYVSGDNTFTASAPTGSATNFSTTVALGDYKFSTWQVTVTDSLSTVSAPANVNVVAKETSTL